MDRGSLDESAIWANRFNVGLARSQKVLQSWLPPRPEGGAREGARTDGDEDGEDDEEEDDDGFTMNETGGIGSKTAKDEDASLEGILKRRPQSANEKLLEQLLGKKAAQAHKKSQQQLKKGLLAPKQAAKQPFGVHHGRNGNESGSDDDDPGRAAALSSRKSTKRPVPTPSTADRTIPGEHVDLEDGVGTKEAALQESGPPPTKRRVGNSYLDELLAEKASKKSKKKKKKGGASIS